MKRIQIIFLAVVLSCAGATVSLANDRAVGGLIIGAGSGAIIGQAAGHDADSVLIGSVIGGAVGYAVGSSLDRPHSVIIHEDGYRPWGRYYVPTYAPRGKYLPRYDYRYRDRGCRETVTVKRSFGRTTRVATTYCDRGHFNDHDWRRDNKWRNDGWHHDNRSHNSWHHD